MPQTLKDVDRSTIYCWHLDYENQWVIFRYTAHGYTGIQVLRRYMIPDFKQKLGVSIGMVWRTFGSTDEDFKRAKQAEKDIRKTL